MGAFHANFGCVAKKKLIWYSEGKRGLLMSIQSQNPFKWCHFEAEIILLCVRWYLRVRHVTHHCIPSEKECQK
jgi:hypothetical protein